MKLLSYIFILSMMCTVASAQQSPVIKAGTQLDGKFLLYGQTVPVKLTVRSMTDSVFLDWNIRGASGTYLISAAGFNDGNKLNFIQPAYQTVLRLAPDETFGLISKRAFQALKKDRKLVYNNTTYTLVTENQEASFKASGQQLKVLHVKAIEEPGEIWILDDPAFPLICQIRNNPLGINFTLLQIK
jgi:hypothetical protein